MTPSKPNESTINVCTKEEEDLQLKPFDKKGTLIRQEQKREIIPRRPDLPKILCPLIVEINLLEEFDLDVVPEVIAKESLPPRKLRLFSMAEADWRPSNGSWKETNDDNGVDGEWRRKEIKAALGGESLLYGNIGSDLNALLCGPYPLSWIVPDPDFKPRHTILPMYPNSKLMGFFKLWGPIESCDCIFQEENRTILVTIKYAKRDSLIQACLCFYHRFLCYNEEPFAMNVQVVNYQDTMEGLASRVPGQLGTVLKQLDPEQQAVFSRLYTKMEALERENQKLAMGLQEKYQETQRKLRSAAKPKSMAAKMQKTRASEDYHKELLM